MSHWCKKHGETHDCGECVRAESRVYPGLRGDPRFAQLLADYDRVSELLGDAQRDLNATTAEREQLTAKLAASQAECKSLASEVERLRFEAKADAMAEYSSEVLMLEEHTAAATAEARELLLEVHRLRAALKRYGRHEAGCDPRVRVAEREHGVENFGDEWRRIRTAPRVNCTCGLDAALGTDKERDGE